MNRLSLTTHNRRQQPKSLILAWWNVVLHIVVLLLLMMFKNRRDRLRVEHFSSNVDRYPILFKYVYETGQEVSLEEQTQESDDDFLDSNDAVSHNKNVQLEETSSSVLSRKRKSRSDDGFDNAVGLIIGNLEDISKDLSQGIKFDMKINQLSEKIPPEILKMNSITQLEKFIALTKIRSDPINVQNFWQLENSDREAWVKYILEA